jgi:cytoskeletal protein RodZ
MSESPFEPDERKADTAAPDVHRGSFGTWLRHQREARSVSLREIADASKISLRYLDALEQDRFDVLPAPVFARGFLREYARVVGLNPDEVVNLFLVALEERRAAGTGFEPNRGVARQRKAPSSLGYGLLLALAVIAFLAVAAAVSFFVERRRSPPPPTTLVAPRTAPPAEAAPASQGVAATSSTAPAAAPPAPAEPAGGTATPPVPARQRIVLVLSFARDCWVEMTVDRRRQSSELRAGGETLTVEADELVTLTLGDASAVTLEVNGRAFSLPAGGARVVRDLRIDRAAAGLDAPAPQQP